MRKRLINPPTAEELAEQIRQLNEVIPDPSVGSVIDESATIPKRTFWEKFARAANKLNHE